VVGDPGELNQTLFCYGLEFLTSRGFLTVHTLFFMRRVCQLEE
jgi:hypothetical protein